MSKFFVHPDIKKAETLPAQFYRDPEVFQRLADEVFCKTWQFLGDQETLLPLNESHAPLSFLSPLVEEPLLLVRDQTEQIRCLSNVCTHRGNLLAHHPGRGKQLICHYHGRRFGLDGLFKSMPEFEQAEDFPRPCDHLHQYPLRNWHGLLFASIEPAFDLDEVLGQMQERIGFMALDQLKYDPIRSRDYLVNGHWALYCDNYLEGFHIPFVHHGLNAAIDYETYETHLYRHMNLQIGLSKGDALSFNLPQGHPDYGKSVSAYYYWVFPNMMFNFYPWGLSINVVRPISKKQSKVSFITYVMDAAKLDQGAGADLDKVEREDEFVVEAVQKGIESRHYATGRFSPTREQGVHHFHRLLAEFLDKPKP
jgi:choline monooxygenase